MKTYSDRKAKAEAAGADAVKRFNAKEPRTESNGPKGSRRRGPELEPCSHPMPPKDTMNVAINPRARARAPREANFLERLSILQ
jgi:hypothetical protein